MGVHPRWLMIGVVLLGCTPGGSPATDTGLADAILDMPSMDRGTTADARPPLDLGRMLEPDAADQPADAQPPRDAEPVIDSAPDAMIDAAPDAAAPPDAAPAECAAAEDCDALNPAGVEEHRVSRIPDCAFRLRRTGDPAAAQALAAEIAGSAQGGVPFVDVDLNRRGVDGITAGAADRLRNHPYVGFRWNDGDMDTADWYPQGMSGISDADPSADPPARRLFVVSWYDHRDARPAKGARISLIDYSDPRDIGYRHLLLVVPERVNGRATFSAVNTGSGAPLHAGGIVWIGDLLYVADTTQGFRVFDLSATIEVANFNDRDRIGVGDGRVDAHGYRYIVPQIARYQLAPDSCPLRFSFAGLDRSADPPRIVSGEYRADDPGGRVVRWAVGPDGWLRARDGVVTATDALIGAQTRMQGGMTWEDAIYISSSSQAGRLGRLYRTRVGQAESSISAWVYGCEDLYFERHTDRIWTPAEHPGARDVVSIVRLAP